MADLAPVPANVQQSATAAIKRAFAAVAIAAGDLIYKLTDGTIGLADANGTTPAFNGAGVAVNSAPGVGQQADYVDEDHDFDPGCTTVAGTVYVLSATPGKICPVADLASGHKVTIVGVGKPGNKLWLKIWATGLSVP